MRRVLILIISLFFSQFMASCAYKPDVQQGNNFDVKQLSQLKIGMTPKQVVFIMGTPLLQDTFHKSRWDYIYSYAKGRANAERRLVTLYFKKGKLSKIDKKRTKKVTLK